MKKRDNDKKKMKIRAVNKWKKKKQKIVNDKKEELHTEN